MDFLWYIPNQVSPGHRLDDTTDGHNSLERLTALARLTEGHGWDGALIGTGALVILPEWLRFLRQVYLAVYGAAVILIMVFLPDGLWGIVAKIGRAHV